MMNEQSRNIMASEKYTLKLYILVQRQAMNEIKYRKKKEKKIIFQENK